MHARIPMNRLAQLSMSLLCLLLMSLNLHAQQTKTDPADARDPFSYESVTHSFDGFHEDYKNLALEGSTLRPQTPVVWEKTEILDGSYVRERIQVGWRPKDKFDLYVTRPKDVKKPPVILYLYSYPENGTRFQSEVWYKGVAKEGYAAVGFVSAITAERAERRARDETFLSLLQESLGSSVHDVQMILNYLESRGDLDMERVGMFATGSGATIAILASATDPRIKAIDVFNPWGDWPDFAAKSLFIPEEQRERSRNKYLDREFLALAAPLDPVLWLSKVKAQTVRLQYVQSEATVPLEAQKKVTEAAPDRAEVNEFANYRVWMSTEHGTEIFGWLRNALQPGAQSKAIADKSKQVKFFADESKAGKPN